MAVQITLALACPHWLVSPDPGNQPQVEQGYLVEMQMN